jgi:NTE family protein
MAYHFKNLVFEGGGVKGIAYVGALEVLEEKGILPGITRVGGTSAGAISALLVGLNFSPKEIREILWNLDFNNFLDSSWGIIRNTNNLIKKYGWYKGDFFRKWVGALIKQKVGKVNATFAEVEALKGKKGFRSLYFIGTNISTGQSKIFSAEDTPNECVADAVRISMSLPIFFAAVRDERDDVLVDGGLINNYPIKLFDQNNYVAADCCLEPDYYQKANRVLKKAKGQTFKYVYNKESLGFRLDSETEINVFRNHAEPGHKKITDFFDYTRALISTVYEHQDGYHLHSDDWQRTVYIDTLGVSTTEFSLTDKQKQALADSGRAGAEAYFKWYDGKEPKVNK